MSEKNDFNYDDIGDELIAEKHTTDFKTLPADMSLWMKHCISKIDRLNYFVGNTVCWLTLPIVFIMAYEIIARYFFTAPTMWAYDLSRMLYGALFTLGSGYALSEGIHIRADFIYRNWKPRTQALVDIALFILFYFPGMILFLIYSIEFSVESWQRQELGMDTAWMPAVYPIKSVLPVSVGLLVIQGFSEVLKCLYTIKRGHWYYES